jgi:hypothetical protein
MFPPDDILITAESWPGGISRAAGQQRVAAIRKNLNVDSSQNIAFADAAVGGGAPERFVGISGAGSPFGTVPEPGKRLFTPLQNRGFVPTDNDSEVKILEEIARGLPQDATGTIHLYTERPACPSCRAVIKQFRERFQGIELRVSEGTRGVGP